MFDSRQYQALPPDAKLVLLTLKHNRLNNMAGIFSFQSGELYTLQNHTGLSVKAIEKALLRLKDENWIIQDDDILWIRNQLKHDPHIKLTHSKHLTGIYNVLNSLPESQIVIDFCEKYGLDKPYESLTQSLSKGLGIQDKDKDKDKEEDKDIPDKSDLKAAHPKIIAAFDRLWKEKYQTKYTWKKKDFGSLKTLLKKLEDGEPGEGPAKLCRAIERYFLSTNEYYLQKRHPFGLLIANINQLLADHYGPNHIHFLTPMTDEEEKKHYDSKRRTE